MRQRLLSICVSAAVCISLIFVSWAGAVSVGDEWFELNPRGPVSIKVNTTATIYVDIENQEPVTRQAVSLMLVVIDPFNGTRIAGPIVRTIDQPLAPHQRITQSASFTIPSGFVNKTLATVISVVGPNNTVRGTTGWGFVTVQ